MWKVHIKIKKNNHTLTHDPETTTDSTLIYILHLFLLFLFCMVERTKLAIIHLVNACYKSDTTLFFKIEDSVIISILWIGKWELRKVRWLAQCHVTNWVTQARSGPGCRQHGFQPFCHRHLYLCNVLPQPSFTW